MHHQRIRPFLFLFVFRLNPVQIEVFVAGASSIPRSRDSTWRISFPFRAYCPAQEAQNVVFRSPEEVSPSPNFFASSGSSADAIPPRPQHCSAAVTAGSYPSSLQMPSYHSRSGPGTESESRYPSARKSPAPASGAPRRSDAPFEEFAPLRSSSSSGRW